VEIIAKKSLASDRIRKQISTIVDADDKNWFSSVNSSTEVQSRRPAMAVYHCRCAFLCYFLLHKQKKVNKVLMNYK
jgi:hypothetical protein